jgi:hypothetical protein
MEQLMSGIVPVKNAVDQIQGACRTIVQSGSVPGAEQICAQIINLANSLIPMAVQSSMSPGAGGAIPPPPGAPPIPLGGQ